MAHIVGIGHHILGKAAIDRIAGVLLLLAQGFPATQTMHAVAAGTVEPGQADTVAFLHMFYIATGLHHHTGPFVARNEGRIGLDRPVTIGCVQVGMAGLDLHQDLVVVRRGNRNFLDFQRFAEFVDDSGFHGLAHGMSP